MRVLIAQINPVIGDLKGNTKKVLNGIDVARKQGAKLVLFPELCLSGYPPEDFLLLPNFIDEVQKQLELIIPATAGLTAVVGLPRRNIEGGEKYLYNSAAVIQDKKLLGFQDKTLLPTYDIFDERRYFEPSSSLTMFKIDGWRTAITICEDIWQHSAVLKYSAYRRDPVKELQSYSPDLVLNLSASPYSLHKCPKRTAVCSRAAATLRCPLIFCNQVGGNDSLIFDGYSLYINAKGEILDYAKGFHEDYRLVDLDKPPKPHELIVDPIEDLYKALVLGVKDYFSKSGFTKCCLGLSGGIDSALVACIAKEALGKENVLGITMPSRYSSPESITDSKKLAQILGIECREIPIEKPFQSYLELLAPQFEGKQPDATEENLQARIRGMILMALSNKFGYIVLSTGNKSELAMGYATLYGDMCGGLAVISDVTKVQVYALARWINRHEEIIPWNTIRKPPSAELRPNQKDSDSLPEYGIVDNVMQAYVEDHLSPEQIVVKFGYPKELVEDLVKRIHRNEYKRRQSPPGLRISEKSFSTGRRFPIVQRFI